MREKRRPHKKRAVVLEYSPPGDRAPRVTAKGQGEIAQKILELARSHGIPLRKDPDLLEILFQVELEKEIPPAVYQVVAEILAFLYTINAGQISAGTNLDPTAAE
ncbi:MAG TPA: EscU/YscU/HrcU family type III secretion system export apparatus switch protein [bacterium]|nr:EscU/YscU/HrcU family type III secretion system export apparatus switch protein [bacterium]